MYNKFLKVSIFNIIFLEFFVNSTPMKNSDKTRLMWLFDSRMQVECAMYIVYLFVFKSDVQKSHSNISEHCNDE